MKADYIKHLIKQGEGLTIEFKSAQHEIPKSIFDTVCAFLNRNGGTILLGVADDGEIKGIEPKYIQKIKKELTSTLNNPQLINPPIYIQPNEVEIENKIVLELQVFESSQVHNTKGIIFDRNNEGDFNISMNTNLVASLYIRKQSTFTENKIYPYATINDLRSDLIQRVRQMAINRQPGHLWESMSDMELLKSIQLFQKDYSTGKEGLTLASILLFGRDEVISSVLPFHKTDAICRIKNIERYDDRDDIRTNLIESYDRLMRFVENHLPEAFVLKGDIRINVRNLLFREIIANTLIHREYTNPFPSKFVIEKECVTTENANKSHGAQQLLPGNFSPYPKNPVIARVFKEIGRAEELGSGVRNIFEYYKYYSNNKPILEEKDIFKCLIFIDNEINNSKKTFDSSNRSDVTKDVTKDVIKDVTKEIRKEIIMDLIKINRDITTEEIANKLNLNRRTISRDIEELKKEEKIQRMGGRKEGFWQILISNNNKNNLGF